jgi:DNA-binding response OmpR family regulator
MANLRVLIVEDEGMVSMLLEDMLSELGHTVAGLAPRLAVARTLAEKIEVDLAILDVNLDGEASYPIAEILTARGVPLIFATGYGATGLKEDWRRAPVLSKPFQIRELAVAIARATAA